MKTAISVKIDRDVRDHARKAARAIGLPLSTIVNAQLRQFAIDRRIEFYEPLPLRPSVGRELKRAHADFKKGKNVSPGFTDVKDAIRWLNS